MNVPPHTGPVQKLGFILVPNFTMIAFSAAVDALRLANYVIGSVAFEWKLFSPNGKPVTASNGISIAVDGSFGEIGTLPELVVCSGNGVETLDHGPLIALLRKRAFHGASIGAVCTGSYILARAGLLDGYRCAIHWENIDSFREEFPHIEVTQELFEIGRNRFTCAGGTASIDMMLALIAARKGAMVASLVTDELIHHRMRDSHERQRMGLRSRLGITNRKLLTVIDEMDKRLERPVSCMQLARMVDLSPRQLERLFQRYLDTTPTRYYLELRLNRARFLLRQTTMPVLSAGLASGFVSASHFSKCYSEHFGRTPSEERKGLRNTPSALPALLS